LQKFLATLHLIFANLQANYAKILRAGISSRLAWGLDKEEIIDFFKKI
jgi:hypothetical protein